MDLADAFVAYSNVVADLETALTIVRGLRAQLVSKQLALATDDDSLADAARAVRVPFLADSTNRVFFEPRALPIGARVACTAYVARGEGEMRVVALDPTRVEVANEIAQTSVRGGSAHVLRLLAEDAAIEVVFSDASTGLERARRVFQLASVRASIA